MSYSKGHTVNCNRVTLGGIFSDDSDTINIVHSDPAKKILVNGVEPTAGGGVTDPLNVNNLNASVAITTPSITPPAGQGLVITANGLQPTAGGTLNISASTIEATNGDIFTTNGNVRVQGTGYISSDTTISAVGDISTSGTGDLVSGRNIYFDGIDLYKRTLVGGIPTDTSYVIYKQLAEKNSANTFTAVNTFSENIVMSGTGKSFTNPGGTISSDTANIATGITCGTITCDNGGTNECKARVFNTRTSGTNGWTIKQALEDANPPGNAANNILQFAATQPQAAGIPTQIYVTASDFDPTQGDSPSVIIDPVTTASGGRVQSSQFITGTTTGRYVLKQDVGGSLNNDLQITAPTGGSEVLFKGNTGGDLLKVGSTVTCNTPLVASGTVDVGSTLDVVGNVSLTGATSAINFGAYSFRPEQLTLSQTGFPISATAGAFTKIFTSASLWTNVNTGATGQSITEGFYKLTVSQTGVSSPNSSYEGLGVLCDFVYRIPADALPNNQLPNPLSFSYKKYLITAAPTIEIQRNATGGQDVHMLFTGAVSGETMNITVRLTKMDY